MGASVFPKTVSTSSFSSDAFSPDVLGVDADFGEAMVVSGNQALY